MSVGSLDYNVSDHLPMYIIRKKIKVKPITSEFTGRTYKHYSREILKQMLDNVDWSELLEESNPDLQWKLFIAILLPILDDICPIRNSRYTNSRPEWITAELMELANDRDRAMKFVKREPTPANILKAKSLRNEAKLAFKTIREEFIKSKLEEYADDPKKFWKELANVIPGNKSQNSCTFNLKTDNHEALSNAVAASYVNDYFATIGQKLADKIDDPTNTEITFLEDVLRQNFLNLPKLNILSFTLEELEKEIKNIEIYKSSGISTISSRILKDVWMDFPYLLLDILNKSIKYGIFPNDWKHGMVIPIPKVVNPQFVNDLRPITLLPLPGKILERLIHNKLYPYLESHNILATNQNGFRKQHGTTDTIFKFLSHVIDNMNQKKVTIAIFIDFKKAFDTLDHEILLQKLGKINISANILKWFTAYLTDRSQVTHMNGITSPSASLSHGVPQGSILGPLLFNLYINDLPKVVNTNMTLYADDSVIFVSSTLPQACKLANEDLVRVNTWCKYHKLSMNASKTKSMYFSANPPDDINDNRIQLLDNTIEFVNVYKYLGIQLEPKLLFHSQFNDTYKLASYKLLLLRRVRPAITEFTALTIVKSMLLPYLDMGNFFFSSQTQKDQGKLDVILNTALRLVYGVRIAREVHTFDLFIKANLFSLPFRRKYFMLNLIHRLIYTGQIDLCTPERETRHNMAPLIKTYVPLNDIVAKSPVFVARELWNAQPTDVRHENMNFLRQQSERK